MAKLPAVPWTGNLLCKHVLALRGSTFFPSLKMDFR